jgi:hypothetical protein
MCVYVMAICPLCVNPNSAYLEQVNFHQREGYEVQAQHENHWACKPCADIWLALSRTCPTCRDIVIGYTPDQVVSRLPSRNMSNVLASIRNFNQSLNRTLQIYSDVQHPEDIALLREAANGIPYRVDLTFPLEAICFNKRSVADVLARNPEIQHPDDIAALHKAANSGPHRVPNRDLNYALNYIRSENSSVDRVRASYGIDHPDDIALLQEAANGGPYRVNLTSVLESMRFDIGATVGIVLAHNPHIQHPDDIAALQQAEQERRTTYPN